jgi:hypothetical protein
MIMAAEKSRIRVLLFPNVLGCLLLLLLPKANPGQTFAPSDAAIPASIDITPTPPGNWDLEEVGYNSTSKKFVLFFLNSYKNSVSLYSRVFASNGKPAGPLTPVHTAAGPWGIYCVDLVYNEAENVFLFVWVDADKEIIYGKILDGTGKNAAAAGLDRSTPTVIRPKVSGAWTYEVRAAWAPGQKQYAVAYAEYYTSATDAKNGFYMTTVDAKLKCVQDRTCVKNDTTQSYPGAVTVIILFTPNTFREVNGKLLWGCPERAGGSYVQPVVWFTDLKGKVATPGKIYPGVKVKVGAEVNSARSPDRNLIFLTWDKTDQPMPGSMTFKENYARLMDGQGKLVSKTVKVPRTLAIQTRAAVEFNSDKNRFLLVYSEHNAPSSPARTLPSSSQPLILVDRGYKIKGGQLLAMYYSTKGKPVGSEAVPLTEIYPATSVLTMPSYISNPMAFHETAKKFLICFLLEKSTPWLYSIWAVPYR